MKNSCDISHEVSQKSQKQEIRELKSKEIKHLFRKKTLMRNLILKKNEEEMNFENFQNI